MAKKVEVDDWICACGCGVIIASGYVMYTNDAGVQKIYADTECLHGAETPGTGKAVMISIAPGSETEKQLKF